MRGLASERGSLSRKGPTKRTCTLASPLGTGSGRCAGDPHPLSFVSAESAQCPRARPSSNEVAQGQRAPFPQRRVAAGQTALVGEAGLNGDTLFFGSLFRMDPANGKESPPSAACGGLGSSCQPELRSSARVLARVKTPPGPASVLGPRSVGFRRVELEGWKTERRAAAPREGQGWRGLRGSGEESRSESGGSTATQPRPPARLRPVACLVLPAGWAGPCAIAPARTSQNHRITE